jgi:exodeoxyribonuclease VII large subunit
VPDRVEYLQRVADASDRLSNRISRTVTEKKNLLLMSAKRLELCSPAARLASDRQTLTYKSELLQSLIGGICKNNRDRLSATAQALSLINPLAVLGRGYSVTKDENGRIVSSVNELALEGEISIILSDGEARAKVTDIKSN